MEMVSDADLRAQFETNVFGLMAVTRAFLPAMRGREGGRIVNVSSVGGRVAAPFFGAYSGTKYAVEAMSDALRMELAPFGVGVSLIEPGVIQTEFTDRSMSILDTYRSPDSPYASVIARANRLREMSDRQAVGPECIARAIERAISSRRPAARYVAPFRAHIMLVFGRWMPTFLVDAVMRLSMGLTRAGVRRPPALPPRPATAT